MFVTITEREFWDAMKAAKRPPEILQKNSSGQQLVVGWRVLHEGKPTHLMVKIYTSIFGPEGQGRSRGLGQDSIRVCLVDTRRDEGAGRTAYTTRTKGWPERLVAKVKEMFELAGQVLGLGEPPGCLRCGAVTVLRTASRGKNAGHQFWGCSNFPRCTCTQDVARPASSTVKPLPRQPKPGYDWNN
jgi:hypothetical protein